jgi:hypothetical protein
VSLVEKGSQEQERTRTGSDTERRTVYHARKKMENHVVEK